MNRQAASTIVLPAPAGTLALFGYQGGACLRVDALPVVALEVTTSTTLGSDLREVHAVAVTGEVTSSPLAAVQYPDGRVVDYVGQAFSNRDAWAESLRRWLGLRKLPRPRAVPPAATPLRAVSN